MEGKWVDASTLSNSELKRHLNDAGLVSREPQPGVEMIECPKLFWFASVVDDERILRYATLVPVRSDCPSDAVWQLCQTVNSKLYWPKAYSVTGEDGSVDLAFELVIPLRSMGFVLPEYLVAALVDVDDVTASILHGPAAEIHAL